MMEAGGDNADSMKNIKPQEEYVCTHETPTQNIIPREEQVHQGLNSQSISSPVRGMVTPGNKSPREESIDVRNPIEGSISSIDQNQVQNLTKNDDNDSEISQTTMHISSNYYSEIPSALSNCSGKELNLDEKAEANDPPSSVQERSSLEQNGVAVPQLRGASSPEIAQVWEKNSLQPSSNSGISAPPATALAPLFEPTAAICDGSLDISHVEISADLGAEQSYESRLSPSDAVKPQFNGVFSSSQSGTSENFGPVNEEALDKLFHSVSQPEGGQLPANKLDGSPSADHVVYPDKPLPITTVKQGTEADGFQCGRELVEVKPQDMEAEYELDLSPLESSSSSGMSSDQSSSDDDDDYEMLNPAEQVARLMQEDGGSDDDGMGRGTNGAGAGPPRTLNEKPEEIVPKPNINITENMKIEELGFVENIVESSVLIKAKTSGEYQVLEFGSLLCLENRAVIGVVAETLGRVEQPYYAVRFTNERAITEASISRGTKVFYVEQHSTPVFTQPLQKIKGSDASNLHDEEVGDDGIEFSDDEAEAEYKRKLKLTRQAKRDVRDDSRDSFPRRGRQRGGKHQKRLAEPPKEQDETSRIGYDDPEGGDDLYTPLARPLNLHEIMGRSEAPLEDQFLQHRADRGGRGGRSKVDRGRGRGDRNKGSHGRGGYRGNFNESSRMVGESNHRAQAPGGGASQQGGGASQQGSGASHQGGGANFYSPPSSNNFLPPQSTPTDPNLPQYSPAEQAHIGQPAPVVHRTGFQHVLGYQAFNPSDNSPLGSPYPQPPFPAPPFQNPYNSLQNYTNQQNQQGSPQPQPSQYFSPSPHYQYHQPQPPQQPMTFHQPYQSHPLPLSTPAVPAGSFINPAFFPSPSTQSAATAASFPPWPQVNNPTQHSSAPNTASDSERALHALNFLQNLSKGDNTSHPS